ncbi:MAG: hypothetical protein IJ506_05000 [Clostridia bacterium]|nr:hypothetical protein [Clostridia bacterium]
MIMDEKLKIKCEEMINRFGKKDYSDEAIGKISEKEIRVKPANTQTEIAISRELCIRVLEQDMRISDTLSNKLLETKATEGLIEAINKKPEFIYEEFTALPLPKEPKLNEDYGPKVTAIYDWFSEKAYFWDGALLLLALLIRILLFPLFLLSVIPLAVARGIAKEDNISEYETKLKKYKREKKKIDQTNAENYERYQKERNAALERLEKRWKDGETERAVKTERLQVILSGQRKEALAYWKIFEYIRKNVFTVPEQYDTEETKQRIVRYLKNFKATTFTQAVNLIEEEDERRKAFESQEKHQKELAEIERKRLKDQEEYNRQQALREEKNLEMQKEALQLQKKLEQEEKKRTEILEKGQKELGEKLSAIQKEVEEANAYDPLGISARDIEDIVRRYSN